MSNPISVSPMSGHIGAEVTGVDLAVPQPPATVEAIRAALRTYRVVVFRDQAIGHREHVAFARNFGDRSS